MGLKIIGAGFGRTGTHSMKLALEQLGYSPCHHMYEVFKRHDQARHWQAAADNNIVNWEQVFKDFQTAVDWPAAAFWKEIAEWSPEAKVLLTVRPSEGWYNSISKTIFPYLTETLKKSPQNYEGEVVKMAYQLIIDGIFGGNIHDKAHVISVYEAHNKHVIETIPAEHLLVYHVGEGWTPLCNWLDCPIPKTDYPRTNSQEEFWRH